MKLLKYVIFAAAAGIALTACDQKDIDFGLQYVDSEDAMYQLFYVKPVTAANANYIYQVEFGDKLYYNNGSSMLARYNAIPSGTVNRWYVDAPGSKTLKMYQSADLNLVYNNSATLTSGLQSVWVYDFDKAPIVIPESEAPRNLATDNDTIAGCSMKFYNFLFKDANTPVDYKVQFYIRDYYNEFESKQNEDGYVPVGEPLAFGESTDWIVWDIKKSVWNSSGYNSNYYLAVKNVETGEYVTYTQSSGATSRMYALTQTIYFGRAYLKYIYGTTEDTSLTPAIGTLTRY